MFDTKVLSRALAASLIAGLVGNAALAQEVGKSPWGPKDEIGRLNLITPESRTAILSRIDGGRSYDLAVEYFIGMPSWEAAGDPPYQMWMTHTPHGTAVSDPMKVGKEMNEHVSYTGSAVSMYAHMGTHIDALNHFGLNGKIWNGYAATEYLGDQGWTVTGAEKLPPIIARGVMVDVAAAKGMQMLPDNRRVTRKDLQQALDRQGVKTEAGRCRAHPHRAHAALRERIGLHEQPSGAEHRRGEVPGRGWRRHGGGCRQPQLRGVSCRN